MITMEYFNREEVNVIRRKAAMEGLNRSFFEFSPKFVVLATLLVFILTGNVLTASQVS
jgi:hypothetical protein